jgi:hypothetical protein
MCDRNIAKREHSYKLQWIAYIIIKKKKMKNNLNGQKIIRHMLKSRMNYIANACFDLKHIVRNVTKACSNLTNLYMDIVRILVNNVCSGVHLLLRERYYLSLYLFCAINLV